MDKLYLQSIRFLAAIAIAGAASSSTLASGILFIDDLATPGIDVIVADNQAAGTPSIFGLTTSADTVPGVGVVNFSGGLPTSVFNVNVSTGITKPVIGPMRIDLNSVNVSGGGAGVLQIGFADYGFVSPAPGSTHTVISNIGGTTNGFIDAQYMVDESGTCVFCAGAGLGVQGPFTGGAFSGSASFGSVLNNPIAISGIVTITHTAPGQISSFNMETSVVPEPGVLGLLGISLVGLGLRRRIRHQ